MRDDDLYFVAFRRGKFTIEQLEAARAGADDGQGLGTWFFLEEMQVPTFLNARPSEISSAHHNT